MFDAHISTEFVFSVDVLKQCSTSRSSLRNCGLWQQFTTSLRLQTTERRDTGPAALIMTEIQFLCVITSSLVNCCKMEMESSQNIKEQRAELLPALS